jgi:hypothetical protein
LIIIANVAAVLIIASVALGAYFIFRGDGNGPGDVTTEDKASQQTTSTGTDTSATQTAKTGTTTSPRTLTTPVLTVPLPQRPPTPTPTPAPTPAPAPVTPPSNSDIEAAEMTAMLDVVRGDPYYGGGDSYLVIAYDPVYSTGTVLITYYYGDVISYTELYMAKDQFGWYVYDEYSYT